MDAKLRTGRRRLLEWPASREGEARESQMFNRGPVP